MFKIMSIAVVAVVLVCVAMAASKFSGVVSNLNGALSGQSSEKAAPSTMDKGDPKTGLIRLAPYKEPAQR